MRILGRRRRPRPPRPVAFAHEIAPDVYCLGPKGRTQTDVYLVRTGTSWTLIDAGWAKDGPAIRQAAEQLFGPSPPGVDPVDALSIPTMPARPWDWRGLWGCPVYLHPDELPLASGDFAALSAGSGPLDNWLDPAAHARDRAAAA